MVTREKDRRVSFVQFALHTSSCTLPTNKSLVDQALWHPKVQKSWLRQYFELKSSQYKTQSTQIQPSCFFGRWQIPYYHHNWSNQRITTILVGLPFKIVISELQISQLGDFFFQRFKYLTEYFFSICTATLFLKHQQFRWSLLFARSNTCAGAAESDFRSRWWSSPRGE